jgi:hypothetical protein
MTAYSPLAAVIDAAERAGKLNLRLTDIHAALPNTSLAALKQALYRQQQRGRLVKLSRGSEHWLIVPLQHACAGAPPIEAWLDQYMRKTLGIPYYVALLSAAEAYGASPYGVMVTQVMVPERRRPIMVGRHEVVFYTRARVRCMPTRWHETVQGRFKIGTPELTALELIERMVAVGGMARVRDVLRALWPSCTTEGLVQALDALQEVPTAQRVGALLLFERYESLASLVGQWLRNKPMRVIPLDPGQVSDTSHDVHELFKVRLNVGDRSANS